ncbi:MAG: FHA domain-containing protein [Blastocatellia bacterium]
MADTGDSVLDKAETLARRLLERLGAKIDNKLSSGDKPATLNPRVLGDLASRIEHTIESSLKDDDRGVRRLAPNCFKVLFTYEETSSLTPEYIEAVGKELTATVFEYINNRRYATRGKVRVEAGQDLFAKTTVVKASVDGEAEDIPQSAGTSQTSRTEGTRDVFLISDAGPRYRVELKPEAAPVYIGRAAGNAVRIDDPSVSRLHCSLSLRTNGSVVIADVGSANGTYVNEQMLGREEARALQSGDVIGIGDFRLAVSEIC